MKEQIERRLATFRMLLQVSPQRLLDKAKEEDGLLQLIDQWELVDKPWMHLAFYNSKDAVAAYWWLRGVAEASDVTLSQLLEAHGVKA